MYLQQGDALLIVDMQNDFITGSLAVKPTPPYDMSGADVIEPIGELIYRFGKLWLPVFFSGCDHPANHCSFTTEGGSWPPHCVHGTHGALIHEEFTLPLLTGAIMIHKGQDATKEAYSAFDDTDLADRLERNGIRRLFVCGLATDYCVKATVLDACKLPLGLEVYFVCDAMTAVNLQPHDGRDAIEAMVAAGAKARIVKWIRVPEKETT